MNNIFYNFRPRFFYSFINRKKINPVDKKRKKYDKLTRKVVSRSDKNLRVSSRFNNGKRVLVANSFKLARLYRLV